MARETLFETQALSFVLSDFGYMYQTTPSPFVLTAGESYIIVWEGQEYVRTAWAFDSLAPGTVGVGSTLPAGGEADPDGLPVTFGYIPATDYAAIFSLEGEGPYSVGLYKEIAEPARLILRDPDGTEQEYPMRSMLEVDTTEGGTVLYSKGQILDGLTIQPDFSEGDMTVSAPDGYLVKNAVIAKPEDCEPENILKGKTIGGIPGELEVPVLEDVTIEPDFSGGNMVVTPDAGKAFFGVTVTKPANLKPENIAKNEVVAGIVGTHEGGGSGQQPYLFCRVADGIQHNYSATGTYTHTATTDIPVSSIVQNALGIYQTSSVTTSTSYSNFNSGANAFIKLATIAKTDEKITVSYAYTVKATSAKWYSVYVGVVVVFSLPGFYLGEDNVMYADENAVEFPTTVFHMAEVTKADLTGGAFTLLPTRAFGVSHVSEILLPPTVTTLEQYVFQTTNTAMIVDFSKHTSIPTIQSTSFYKSTYGLTIRVPSALYSQWIAATNWSAIADYIVAV